MLQTIAKPKTCAYEKCGKTFLPLMPMQRVCGPLCAGRFARAKTAEKKVAERKETKARKEAIKRIPDLIAEAQDAFNSFIRERDKNRGCFVCDVLFDLSQTLGGVMDAGHVRSRGAAGHLRFNEDNCHGECKHCNGSWGAKPHEIEAGAIRRIGPERYAALKADNTPHKWTHAELRGIRDTYRAKLKTMKKETA